MQKIQNKCQIVAVIRIRYNLSLYTMSTFSFLIASIIILLTISKWFSTHEVQSGVSHADIFYEFKKIGGYWKLSTIINLW